MRLTSLPHIAALIAALLVVPMGPCLAADEAPASSQNASVGAYRTASFAPTRGELFAIPVHFAKPELIESFSVDIVSADGDQIRLLPADQTVDIKDTNLISWDGKDERGKPVPNEVYHPVLMLKMRSGEEVKIDYSATSGGEEVYDFDKVLRPGAVEYELPEASRVLVRGGIQNGPMLRTIVDWEPRAKGYHVERWNGLDEDGLFNLEAMQGAAYLIIGYKLPDHSIITYGNTDITYREYREANQWPVPKPNLQSRLLERDGRVMRPEFYLPVEQLQSPVLTAQLLSATSRKPSARVEQFEEIIAKVVFDPKDEYFLSQSQYEISFFVDNEFIAEEERGFIPFMWRWSPGRHGIEPGEHIFTVNVSSYDGQVAVKNMKFVLEPQASSEE